MSRPRYVDAQFWSSVRLTIVFYFTVVPLLCVAAWWLEAWAAAGLFGFLLWAYRWPIGEKFGWCQRRPGALPVESAPDAR